IPFTLVAIHFAIASLSGASVNPARSLGSAIVGGDVSKIWIYIVGPILGGVIGWAAGRLLDGGGRAAPAPPAGREEGGRGGSRAAKRSPDGNDRERLGDAPGRPQVGVVSSVADAGGAGTASRIGRSLGPAPASQHAAWCPAPTWISGGSSTRHRSNASGQRG